MTRKRGDGRAPGRRQLQELLDAVAAADRDEDRFQAFVQAFAAVAWPVDGFVIGEPVVVSAIAYDGNPRRGFTATCQTRGGSHTVGVLELRFPDRSAAALVAEAYRSWLGVELASGGAAEAHRVRRHKAGVDEVDVARPVDLVVLAVKRRGARCRIAGTERELTLRSGGLWRLVPGEIATVRPAKSWSYAGHPYLSGEIEKSRIDAPALGLVPLALTPAGDWDPAEEYWGEEGEPLPDWARAMVARGVRPRFEMEQVVPGADADEPELDPIVEAVELNQAGQRAEAEAILMGLLAQDLRCLDGHAHLGNAAFRSSFTFEQALRHYEIGVRLGEEALGPGFDGVLPWGLIDNRPFLRCMHGLGISLWRLGRMVEAAAIFERMLWLNPADNQGERFNLTCARDGRAWEEEQRTGERLG